MGTVTLKGPRQDDIAIVEDGSEPHKTFVELGWKPQAVKKTLEPSGTTASKKTRGKR